MRDPGALPLPGVVVSARSPALQGSRSATTSPHGDYIISFLAPGDYTVTFELPGFAAAAIRTSVELGETTRLDAHMELAGLQETVVVAAPEALAASASVAAVHRAEMVQRLPTDRTLDSTVMLAPGVNATGAAGRISIAGGMAYQNLYLVDGVAVNENLRGQPLPLYIEDALQETRVAAAGISAEFGRFAGGIVNAVTKSGGNSIGGSIRGTFTNDRWRAVTPFGEPRTDQLVPTAEFTLGGPVRRDRVWFFTAGRVSRPTVARQLPYTALPYEYSLDERRIEGKLTSSIRRGDTLRLAYQRIFHEETNATSGPVMDLRAVDDRRNPQNLLSLNYTAVLRGRFFVEAQYSRRRYTSYSGSRDTDPIAGTQLRDLSRGGIRYWSPSLCAVCGPDRRDNRNVVLKASYYRSTRSAGAHSLVLGYDVFDDQWNADGHRTGSDWMVTGSSSLLHPGADTIYPVWRGDGTTTITWSPVLRSSSGNTFRTHSVFVNDQWRQGRFTLNLGLRWDKNDGRDGAGTRVVRDAAWSPRASASWDPVGNGEWAASVSAGRYVSAMSNAVASTGSTAGSPATFTWPYTGPAINLEPPYLTPEAALPLLFDWFNRNGIAGTPPTTLSIPGVDTTLASSLRSPSTWEVTTGLAARVLGASLRAQFVRRRATDFYSTRVDRSTGSGTDPGTGRRYDKAVVENTGDASRNYAALVLEWAFRPHRRLSAGGSWTLSSTSGNFDGESAGSGPMTADVHAYPEYKSPAWSYPEGRLSSDQRHALRAWVAWQLPLGERGDLEASLLQQAASGTPYGAVGAVDLRDYVVNPGYATPQGGTSVAYYFTARDAFATETGARTDLAVGYSRKLAGPARVFVQAHVLNVFNQFALENVNYLNKTVYTARTNARRYRPFDAFNASPAEGVNWDFGPQFGKPTDARAYTLPRTFRFSAGIRF